MSGEAPEDASSGRGERRARPGRPHRDAQVVARRLGVAGWPARPGGAAGRAERDPCAGGWSRCVTLACGSRRSRSTGGRPHHGRPTSPRPPTSGLDGAARRRCPPLEFRRLCSPERQLVFDANDFDETLRGPWEWDLKRLAASFTIAGQHLGFSSRTADGRHPRSVGPTAPRWHSSPIEGSWRSGTTT